jgi:FMN phosphatase YigB (HAD superfamily)
MSDQAITFDFHNTLAMCPEWFELEVRRLPSTFLTRWSDHNGRIVTPGQLSSADQSYRQLRTEIIDHGNELTAADCLERVFAAVEVPVSRSDIDTGIESIMLEVLDEAAPIEGSVETVRAIHVAGIPLGVVSSAVYHPFLEWTLERFGISDAIRVIVTSASAGFYKSRPEIYWHAAELMGTAPERMVHVGDSLRFDVGGAARAGFGTVWLQREGAEPTSDSPVPDLTVQTLLNSAAGIMDVLQSRGSVADPSRV